MRILLIEHEQTYGGTLRENLRQEGYTIDWLPDNTSFFDILESDQFQIIIFDIDFPELDWIKTLKQIRKKRTQIYIMALSNRNSVSERVIGLDAGADDFLIKPVSES